MYEQGPAFSTQIQSLVYLKRTNFRVYIFSRAKKNRISRVFIFANSQKVRKNADISFYGLYHHAF